MGRRLPTVGLRSGHRSLVGDSKRDRLSDLTRHTSPFLLVRFHALRYGGILAPAAHSTAIVHARRAFGDSRLSLAFSLSLDGEAQAVASLPPGYVGASCPLRATASCRRLRRREFSVAGVVPDMRRHPAAGCNPPTPEGLDLVRSGRVFWQFLLESQSRSVASLAPSGTLRDRFADQLVQSRPRLYDAAQRSIFGQCFVAAMKILTQRAKWVENQYSKRIK